MSEHKRLYNLLQLISLLLEAIRPRKRVVLHQYHSPNSDPVLDLMADPIGFSINMKYLHAFEPENRYDMRAIEIHAGGSKLVYIAQAGNHVSSTLMDLGAPLRA